MDSNISNQQYFKGALPLAEPHFDEEATLLSARPVVPLKEIEAEERSGKRLVFGLAMACSLVVGALGATLIYKQRGQGQSTAIISTAVPGAAGITVDEPVGAPAIAEEVGGATGTFPEAGAATVDKKAVPWVSLRAESFRVKSERKKTKPQPQVEERGLPRAERIDAWRLRLRSEREAQRESGGRQRKSSDDLLRIREIFEGPPRP